MRFHQRSTRRPRALGVLAGSFNPPTIAHQALVQAAGYQVDEVLCVVPSIFPHKEYFGATLEQRLDMLAEAETLALTSIASSEKGLFIDIAREAREHYGAETRIYFVCGRDAAERILSWDYGRPGVVEEMLQEFELLVAARDGEFRPPVEFQHRIHPLGLRGAHDQVSSTEVRDRIARGEPWEHLVPKEIADRVREIYS
ncbi:MAG TPA: nicotinate-nicotinamide nucleotide adenylyltransferase [Bryobacteraceae bacterium]|nr:nicotinate-nicotinamide nucleotide adenylyltransferase [Bryobacteraceae bacterium]